MVGRNRKPPAAIANAIAFIYLVRIPRFQQRFTFQLDRKIGQLKEVVLHKEGVDSYLLSELECRIGNQVYVMKGPRQWLDNLDPLTEASYEESKGYEPLAHEELHDLPAATALTLTVDNVFYYYVETGMFTS